MIVIDTNVVIEYLKGNEIIIQTVNEYSKNYGMNLDYIYTLKIFRSDQKWLIKFLIRTWMMIQ